MLRSLIGARLCILVMTAFEGLAFYCALGTIMHRHTLHIAKRNLVCMLCENFVYSSINVAILGRWYHLLLGWDVFEKSLVDFSDLAWACSATVLTGGAALRLHILSLKFRDAGGANAVNSKLQYLVHKLFPDCRTVKGQHRALLACIVATIPIYIPVYLFRKRLCLEICKAAFPVYGSTIWLNIPIATLFGVGTQRFVKELKEAGSVQDDLGVVEGARFSLSVMSVLGTPSTVLYLLADFGIATRVLQEMAVVLAWLMFFSAFYTSHVMVIVSNGLGPFSKPRLMPVPASSFQQKTIAFERGEGAVELPSSALQDHQSSRSQSAANVTGLIANIRGRVGPGCDAEAQQEFELQALYDCARRKLSEEPVRCAVVIVQVLSLSLAKEDRDKMRSLWTTILEDHFSVGCAWPISLHEHEHQEVLAVLKRSIHRKVLFPDDCVAANETLSKVLKRLAPAVEAVLLGYITDSTFSKDRGNTSTGDSASLRHSVENPLFHHMATVTEESEPE